MKCVKIGDIYINVEKITYFEFTPFKKAVQSLKREGAGAGPPPEQDTPASLVVNLTGEKPLRFSSALAIAGIQALTD
jgi:hypothetical protein